MAQWDIVTGKAVIFNFNGFSSIVSIYDLKEDADEEVKKLTFRFLEDNKIDKNDIEHPMYITKTVKIHLRKD